MICPNPKCGKEIPDGSKFCLECGSNISEISGQEQEADGDRSLVNSLRTFAGRASSLAEDAELKAVPLAERYEILEEVGRGGFAVVYTARDKKLDRTVAVKRLVAEQLTGAQGQQTIERFTREARAIASLNHRNIVQVFDHDCDDEGHYIVMEYVEGGTLRDYLKERGKLPLAEASGLLKGMCQGLSFAHRKNLVHRDIKPGNILLAREGDELVPKIMDFGLARAGLDSNLSVSGYGMGTPYYMPPEQRRDAKSVNHTADIYALGKTFYEMVTGEIPDNVDPEAVPPPPQLAKVILKCIKSRPEERYFSVDELLKDVEELDSAGAVATPMSADRQSGACPSCGTLNSEDLKFCRSCGGGLFEPCPKCGAEDRIGAKHCGSCGVEVAPYKEATEALAKAQEYQKTFKYSRAIKEASRGIQTGCLKEELGAVRAEAEKSKGHLDALRADVTEKLNEERYEEAEPALRAALELDPSQDDLNTMLRDLPAKTRVRNVRDALEQARTALEQKRFPIALEQCKRILGDEPGNSDAAALMAKAEQYQEDLLARMARVGELRAAFELEKALEELNNLTADYAWHGDLAEAISECDDVLRRVNYLRSKASSASEKGDPASAMSAWKELLKLNAESPEARREVAALSKEITRRRLRLARNIAFAAVVLFVLCYAVVEARSNRDHVAQAESHTRSGDVDKARTELEDCGWFWAWGKAAATVALDKAEVGSVRTSAEKSKRDAEAAEAPSYAKVKWDEANSLFEEGRAAFEESDWGSANTAWQDAKAAYIVAQGKAREVVKLRDLALGAQTRADQAKTSALRSGAGNEETAKQSLSDANGAYKSGQLALGRGEFSDAQQRFKKAASYYSDAERRARQAIAKRQEIDRARWAANRAKTAAAAAKTQAQNAGVDVSNCDNAKKDQAIGQLSFDSGNYPRAKFLWDRAKGKYDTARNEIIADRQREQEMRAEEQRKKKELRDKAINTGIGIFKRYLDKKKNKR